VKLKTVILTLSIIVIAVGGYSYWHQSRVVASPSAPQSLRAVETDEEHRASRNSAIERAMHPEATPSQKPETEEEARHSARKAYDSHAMDGFGSAIFVIVLGIVSLALYLLPTFVAFGNKKRNAGAICALNLLLGWTLIGWVVALVWSCTVEDARLAVPPSWACRKCQSAIHSTDRFCPFCSAPINWIDGAGRRIA
jgi:hypothetical protein